MRRILTLALMLLLVFLARQAIQHWRAEALFPSFPSSLRADPARFPSLPEQIARLDRCIVLQPGNADHRLLLAERLLLRASLPHQKPESQLRDLNQAQSEILAAQRAKPIDPRGQILLGQYLLERGRTEEALARFRQAVAMAPHKGQVHAYLAMALIRAQAETPERPRREALIEEARILFRQAADLDPSLVANIAFLSSLADLHLAVAQPDRALRYLQRIAALPDQWQTFPSLLKLSSLYLQRGEARRATEIYGRLLKNQGLGWDRPRLEAEMERVSIFYPQAAELHQLLGEIHSNREDWPKAVLHYRRWVLLQPGSAEGHFRLGLAYEKMGKGELALAQYEETLRIDRGHSGATQKIVDHYRSQPGARFK